MSQQQEQENQQQPPQPPSVFTANSTKLFVSNLPQLVDKSELCDLFNTCGSILKVRFLQNIDNDDETDSDSDSDRFAIILMSNPTEAMNVANQFNEYMLRNVPIRVELLTQSGSPTTTTNDQEEPLLVSKSEEDSDEDEEESDDDEEDSDVSNDDDSSSETASEAENEVKTTNQKVNIPTTQTPATQTKPVVSERKSTRSRSRSRTHRRRTRSRSRSSNHRRYHRSDRYHHDYSHHRTRRLAHYGGNHRKPNYRSFNRGPRPFTPNGAVNRGNPNKFFTRRYTGPIYEPRSPPMLINDDFERYPHRDYSHRQSLGSSSSLSTSSRPLSQRLQQSPPVYDLRDYEPNGAYYRNEIQYGSVHMGARKRNLSPPEQLISTCVGQQNTHRYVIERSNSSGSCGQTTRYYNGGNNSYPRAVLSVGPSSSSSSPPRRMHIPSTPASPRSPQFNHQHSHQQSEPYSTRIVQNHYSHPHHHQRVQSRRIKKNNDF